MAARAPRHLYIHVPFCRERCDYCEFYSLPAGGEPEAALLDGYVDALLAEWRREAARLSMRRLETVYFGGGTPSLLGPARLARLLVPLAPLLTPHAEVTVETNPEDAGEEFAQFAAGWRAGDQGGGHADGGAAAGGLRVSLGVQSFQPRLRAAVGRRATADPAAAVHRLRRAGVANLSVDLIFGMPGQTRADVDSDLAAIAALRPDHVSWYELGVVPGTPLAERLRGGGDDGARAAEADLQAELYRHIVRGLGRLGYRWYEVSNFALPGRRSRHNLVYWRGRPYLGLGPSAVSTVGDERWRTAADARAFAAALARGRTPPREHEHLDQTTRLRERLLLAARIGAGLELAELEPCLDRAALGPLAASGYISLRGGTLRVTRKGRYVANAVCVRLFRATCF
jgi:putative oxygen-independent coproporphyrinogen III oxidase